uniref:3-hydroxyacyl-CoA dehydrogenase (PaaH, hbd, fadB, mmgB) n=1 Tax=uncultured marine thaumarchaeote KM3_26_F01 TaxID=1456108 RepID=A0A075GW95_9ARCH|nr:3-hydroxyacyl-CoA dehydrogenase (paaH, hbd, fadB, mmgB) [uncultured marine thaumarchaeote KM3_26_F01]
MVLFVKRVGVVGGGAMGSQIADIMAINGKEVIIKDVSEEYLKKARENVEKNLDSLLEFNLTRADKEIERIEKSNQIQLTDEQKSKIQETLKPKFNEDMKKEAMDKIQTTTDYKEFNDVDLVIEAVLENVDLKREIFSELDKTTPSHVVLATNTSSLSVTEIASATKRPEKVVGVHFFNPPVTLPLVEVIPGMETSEETVNDMIDFMSTVRNHRYPMQPIKVKEVPGFLVNRILFAMMNEAYSCYDEGVASMRDIDLAMKAGAGMPMGPFELSDLVGIDVIYHVEEEVRKMIGGNTTRQPSQTIRKLYHAGRYGKKTKRGFYDYR